MPALTRGHLDVADPEDPNATFLAPSPAEFSGTSSTCGLPDRFTTVIAAVVSVFFGGRFTDDLQLPGLRRQPGPGHEPGGRGGEMGDRADLPAAVLLAFESLKLPAGGAVG